MFQRSSNHKLRRTFLVSLIFLVYGSAFFVEAFSSSLVAHAQTASITQRTAPCTRAADPTRQSLLIVLLDRSGSLIVQPGATDPDGYSTSVTKALADLWPGSMAVIPFSNASTPVLGPATLSDPLQQAGLKAKVASYPIGGNTPLEPAMRAALNLLHQQNMPAGSRIVIITDGNPTGVGNNDGAQQEQRIRQQLIPAFCSAGIPVSAFGLTIDAYRSDGQDANKLLSDIANGTGTSYTNVKGPEDLAREVISLYAQWQQLTFTQVKGQSSNYPVSVDTFAKQVSIVTFRSDSTYNVELIGPDGNAITQGIIQTKDRHYTIDNLNISGAIVHGTYTINTGTDPNAQVYALVNSPIKLQVIQPATSTATYANQSVLIQAQFMNESGTVTPEVGAASVLAQVTLLVNGQPAGPATNTIVLSQQKTAQGSLTPIFSGGTLIYNQSGQLKIKLQGNYQQVKRETSTTIQLLKPIVIPRPAPPPNYKPLIIGTVATLLFLALLGLIVWLILSYRRSQPKPYGYITNGRRNGDVDLADFSRGVISSQELQTRGTFNFSANFEVVFTKEGAVKIRATDKGSEVTVDLPFQGKSNLQTVTSNGVDLKPKSKIYTNGCKVASFEITKGRTWS